MGILQDAAFERSTDTLTDGDILLLLSDGAVSEGVAWVEETLRDFDAAGSMKRLAEEIAVEARRRQQGAREDDITVVAMQVCKNKSGKAPE